MNPLKVAVLCLAFEKNSSLKSLNLDTNRIGPDTLASLFEAMANATNSVVEIHVTNQAQSNMGCVSGPNLMSEIIETVRCMRAEMDQVENYRVQTF